MNAGELVVSLLLKAGDFKAQVQAAQERLDNVRDAAREAGKAMSDAAGRGTAGLDGLGTSAKKAAADLRDIDLSDWRQQFKATSEQFNALYAEMDAHKKGLFLEIGVTLDKDGIAKSAQTLYGDLADRLKALSQGEALDIGQRLGFSRQSIEFLRQGKNGIEDILVAADGSTRELSRLGKAAQSAGKELEQAGNKGALSFERLKGTLTKVLGVIGGVAVIKSSIAQYYEQAQAIEKTSDALGMSIEDWQAWQRTAAAAGVDAEELSTRFMDLGDWMQDLILHDSGPLKDATKDLGVSFTDAKGKAVSFEEGLLRLSDATSKIDRQKATSILTQIGFDEKTIPLILKGRKGIEELLKVQKAQAIYSKQDIENAKKQREAQQRLHDAWEALSSVFVSTVSPAITFLTNLLSELVGWVKENKQFVILFFTALAGVITTLMLPALTAMATAAWAAIAPFTPLIAIAGALALVIDDLITYIDGGESAFGSFWKMLGTGDEIGARFKAIWEGIKDTFSGILNLLGGISKLIGAVFSGGQLYSFSDALNTIWGGLTQINDVFVSMLDWVGEKLNGLPDWIKDWLGGDESSRPEEEKTEAKPGGVADSMRVADARPSILPPQVRAGDARPGSVSNVNNSRQMTSTTNVGEVKVYTQATDAEGMAQGVVPALRNQTAQADSAFRY
ncbi:phage tail tape measure protein [uncultured Bilophila sp.]|jgi:hypothetical protein|uniref:phage tail tape measure protein n=1 Tax=uncultured Bilophila sp. TaxID=529385 RepID=UPI0025E3BB91|nr:phage tail tape measure protein [uncultured Bilophila sp.]